MAFVMTLGFATEQDKEQFVERILPKLRGQEAEPAKPEEEDELQRLGVSVTSASAARDICHQLVAFLAHSKNDSVSVFWEGADGSAHNGLVTGNSARDAEVLAVRVGEAAKVHLDAEKSQG
jgi:hypothetical protein